VVSPLQIIRTEVRATSRTRPRIRLRSETDVRRSRRFLLLPDTKNIFSQIDRDKDLTYEQKERQRENARGVLRFCTNKTDCRRRQILVSLVLRFAFDSFRLASGRRKRLELTLISSRIAF
jgi:superfamily II DNA helicase RecQ